MVFLLNSRPVDALAMVVHKSKREPIARAWVKKLRVSPCLASTGMFRDIDKSRAHLGEVIPRQQFEVPIQVCFAFCAPGAMNKRCLGTLRQ